MRYHWRLPVFQAGPPPTIGDYPISRKKWPDIATWGGLHLFRRAGSHPKTAERQLRSVTVLDWHKLPTRGSQLPLPERHIHRRISHSVRDRSSLSLWAASLAGPAADKLLKTHTFIRRPLPVFTSHFYDDVSLVWTRTGPYARDVRCFITGLAA
jgi:hypothetical protein